MPRDRHRTLDPEKHGEGDRQAYAGEESSVVEEAYGGKGHHIDVWNRGAVPDQPRGRTHHHPNPGTSANSEFHSRSGVVRRR